ncbi:hypothetical protein [Desulfovibrio sp. MES5]|uniref:hypothetical protein n=1 Tax=Desulfovibrio sp. MES5 TaxID=1899016 RepID=UPI0025BF165E|nr:hypothetical protein [Desulfovibrio sp. MES5]
MKKGASSNAAQACTASQRGADAAETRIFRQNDALKCEDFYVLRPGSCGQMLAVQAPVMQASMLFFRVVNIVEGMT